MQGVAAYKGINIATESFGNPSHPPVILLHGGGQTRHSWGAAAQTLAENGFYAQVADLRGHGDSDWSAEGEYALEHFAQDVDALVRRMPAKPVLVGASLGGLASLVASSRFCAGLVRALVLVDVVPKVNPEGVEQITGFMRASPDGFASLKEASELIAEYIPHRKRQTNYEGLKKNLRLAENGRYFWHWDPQVLTVGDPQNALENLERDARSITIPTLLVRGGRSNIVDDDGAEHFRKLIPHAEHISIAKSGHMVAGDDNTQFNTAILDFLNRI